MQLQQEPLVERVEETIARHRMLRPGQTVLAAVSGGPDSVCLLHALLALGYAVEVAHFDHQTRNGASAADAAFVRQAAERHNLPFHHESQPVQALATAAGAGFEAHARALRYGFLLKTARARRIDALATGHHADDQAETVLMRLLRGTGPRGLSGIPPVRIEDGIRIVRPLIDCRRDDILAFLDAHGHASRHDHSNADTTLLRNRLRHELLPHLEAGYNPAVSGAMARLADAQRVENEFVEPQALAFLEQCSQRAGIDRRRFAAGHAALQRRAVVELAWRRGVDCPFDRVDGAARFIANGGSGRSYDLGGGVLLRNTRDLTEVMADSEAPAGETVRLTVPGEARAFGKRFRARLLPSAPVIPLQSYCTPARQVFDAAMLGERVVLRQRRPGDRFTPLGMEGSMKLKSYFTGLGLPMVERNRAVIVEGERGIAWVVGHAVSADAAVTARTTCLAEIEVHDEVE